MVPVPKQHKTNLEMLKDIVFGKLLVSISACGINYSRTDFRLTLHASAIPVLCTFAGQYLPYFIYQPLPLMTSFFLYLYNHSVCVCTRTHTHSITPFSLQRGTSTLYISPPTHNKTKQSCNCGTIKEIKKMSLFDGERS